ncbi:hypothetical protein CQ043_22430 [Paenibacillus sp. MYb63]|nr:hypothetical protein CQ043_22430 [Paenibacillus sp. MYb63]PRA45641.1 hypothetical protein CQ061_22390 [Paenibacillus sp. MYb67]
MVLLRVPNFDEQNHSELPVVDGELLVVLIQPLMESPYTIIANWIKIKEVYSRAIGLNIYRNRGI